MSSQGPVFDINPLCSLEEGFWLLLLVPLAFKLTQGYLSLYSQLYIHLGLVSLEEVHAGFGCFVVPLHGGARAYRRRSRETSVLRGLAGKRLGSLRGFRGNW